MNDRQLLIDALALLCQLLPNQRYKSEQRVIDALRARIVELEGKAYGEQAMERTNHSRDKDVVEHN